MTPILNIDYPNIVNTIFNQQNTNLNVVKDVPTYNSFDDAQNDETLKV